MATAMSLFQKNLPIGVRGVHGAVAQTKQKLEAELEAVCASAGLVHTSQEKITNYNYAVKMVRFKLWKNSKL